jgi:CDP-glucose 4,6-dehydratase
MIKDLDFWKGKKVFLTGHTGFKGSWLSLWLIKLLNVKLTGYALKPATKPSLFETVNIKSEMNSIIGDVRNLSFLKKSIIEAKPDIIIHMAAQPLVYYSYSNPIKTYETNVMGTVNLLEAARNCKSVKAILIITSDKCYENKEVDRGYREEESMGGFDPYSSSKGCVELVCSAYRNSYFNVNKYEKHGVAVATARAGNVIGGGDWAKYRLIPDFIRAIEKKEKFIIRNPKAIRPWQHILDLTHGYLILCRKLYEEGKKFSESFNFGPDNKDVKNVQWITEYLVKTWDDNIQYKINGNKEFLHEAHFLKLDSTKAHNKLNWRPRLNLSMSLDKICAWHKAQIAKEDMNKYCTTEIKNYIFL